MLFKFITTLLSLSNNCYNNIQDNLNYIKHHDKSSYEIGINQFISRHYINGTYNKSSNLIRVNNKKALKDLINRISMIRRDK